MFGTKYWKTFTSLIESKAKALNDKIKAGRQF